MLTVAGTLVGGIEKILPSEAKQSDASISPRLKTIAFDIFIPIKRPIIRGISAMQIPKMNDASMSPIMIVSILIGHDMRRSRVLDWASHGTTIGDTEVAVKKRIIPRRPGSMNSIESCLPIVKERNKKMGKSTPNIITGPLE
jgi:hypothetical protein